MGVLSKAGYHTMGVVDTPFFIRNGFGYDRGFDDFVGQGLGRRHEAAREGRRAVDVAL